MSNLQKFNQTLEDFNQEVEQLKDVSGAFKKLQKLTETYNSIIKQFEENSKTLDKINELQKAQQEKVAKSLRKLRTPTNKIRQSLQNLLKKKLT
jgi:ABC-type transporter Mla subunit MlaD